MVSEHRLLACTIVACVSAPVAQALSPVAAGLLTAEQRWSRQVPTIRAMEPAAASGHRNSSKVSLCSQERLIPEFYVLGGKNTATSSLARDLRQRGVLAAPRDRKKEWWFFRYQGDTPVVELERKWLQSLPPCPAERTLMADFSVTNLFTVPFPKDLNLNSEFGYYGNKHAPYWDAASHIRQFSGEAAKDLKFLVMLREPLARIQSEYYHTLHRRTCHGCGANSSFVESFEFNVGLLQQSPPQVSDWFWKSFYARQVEEYLRHFDAAQFTFVPNLQYISVDPPAFSATLLAHLDVQAEPWAEASHRNFHSQKPPLDVELPPGTASREAFQVFFAAENDRLVKVLARAHLGGAWLPGYAGVPGDEALVRAWLESSW